MAKISIIKVINSKCRLNELYFLRFVVQVLPQFNYCQMMFITTMIASLTGFTSSNTDKRQLLLFTKKNTVIVEKQLAILNAEHPGMIERDITFKVIIGNEL